MGLGCRPRREFVFLLSCVILAVFCVVFTGRSAFAADVGSSDVSGFDKAAIAEKLGFHVDADGHVSFVTPERADLGGSYMVPVGNGVADDGAYAVIQTVSQDMVSLSQTFSGSLFEVHAILVRMEELIGCVANEPATADVESVLIELSQLYDEMIRIRNTVCFDECYGLAGVTVSADLPGYLDGRGTVLDFELQDSYDIFVTLKVLPDLLLDNTETSLAEAFNVVRSANKQVARMLSILGSVQNSANHLVDFSVTCDENLKRSGNVSGDVSVQGNMTDRVASTDPDYIITSSLDNMSDAIYYLQFMEGVLTETHSITQRMYELRLQYGNDTYSDADKYNSCIEYEWLRKVIEYMANVTSWEGHHGLNQSDGAMIFPCGWAELCHNEVVVLNRDMSPDSLGLPASFTPDVSDVQSIESAICLVSSYRAYLGSWQNACEHIVSLCERVLDRGPMIGNKFGYDDTTGHHTLDVITGEFETEIGHIGARIDELTARLQDDGYTDVDKSCIQSEIDCLYDAQDLLVDLISTRTSNITHVSKDSEVWGSSAEITVNHESYFYQLTYFSNLSPTTDVCMVDYIEDGDSSSFAGTLTGIDLSEVDSLGIPVQVFAILYDGGTSVSRAVLPDVLPEGAWVEIDTASFDNWSHVQALAFYFGDTVFGPEQGMCRELSVTLNMVYDHGAKPGSEVVEMPVDGYYLQNTCYTRERTGDSDEIQQHMSVSSTVVRLSEAPVGTGTLRISKKVNWIDRGGLVLSMTVDKETVTPGDELTYTITAENTGETFRASNVIITDVLPQGVTFKSASAVNGETFVWDSEPVDGKYLLNSVLPKGSCVLTIVGTVDGTFSDGDMIRNTAFVVNDDIPVSEPVHVDTTVNCSDDNGDGIPDYLQYKVHFSVIHGTMTNGVRNLTVFVTKLDSNGNPSSDGVARLFVEDIPSFTADAGYTGGSWDGDAPIVGHVVTSDETYTYTYSQLYVPPDPGNPVIPPVPG